MAVDFDRPYVLGEKRRIEFSNSQVKLDHSRVEAGGKGYAPYYWQPEKAVNAYSEAGCIDPKYDAFVAAAAGHPERRFVRGQDVLNAAMIVGR